MESFSPEYFLSAMWVIIDSCCKKGQSIPVRIFKKKKCTNHRNNSLFLFPKSLRLTRKPEPGLHLISHLTSRWDPNVENLQCLAKRGRPHQCAWESLGSKRLLGIKKKKKRFKGKMQQEAETWTVCSQALAFGWIWVRVTEPVGRHWVVWMGNFRALQTSHQRSVTQCTRNHWKPSELEINHQETGSCLQKVARPSK